MMDLYIGDDGMKTATFGAGCFWGVELAFSQQEGVVETAVGYSGGQAPNPTYEMVCGGQTGHAEVVEVKYDPSIIAYEQLLALFWSVHDPTTLNRQGPDVGTQYRSIIMAHNEEQAELARASRKAMDQSGRFSNKIVTEIVPASEFYRAEEYHQKYLEKKGLRNCH